MQGEMLQVDSMAARLLPQLHAAFNLQCVLLLDIVRGRGFNKGTSVRCAASQSKVHGRSITQVSALKAGF